MPTLDRLFLGLIVSALVAGSAQALVIAAQAQSELKFLHLVFSFFGSVLWIALVVFFLQLPIWILLHFLRVPDLVGSAVAGSLTFAAYGHLTWVLSNHPMPEIPTTPPQYAYVIAGALVGALSGFACWRVAQEDLG